eukprot:7294073-Pyramimonas_sp.AAC.1
MRKEATWHQRQPTLGGSEYNARDPHGAGIPMFFRCDYGSFAAHMSGLCRKGRAVGPREGTVLLPSTLRVPFSCTWHAARSIPDVPPPGVARVPTSVDLSMKEAVDEM